MDKINAIKSKKNEIKNLKKFLHTKKQEFKKQTIKREKYMKYKKEETKTEEQVQETPKRKRGRPKKEVKKDD